MTTQCGDSNILSIISLIAGKKMLSFLVNIKDHFQSYSLPSQIFLILSFLYSLTYLDTSHKRQGRTWKAFQYAKFWGHIRNYFDGSVHIEEPLDPKQLYIFGAFPHGTHTLHHFLTMTDTCKMLSKLHAGPRRDLVASILFYIPLMKELMLWCGNVDASSQTANYNLKRNTSLMIFVGGEKEQLLTKPRENKIYVQSRKGFIRLALKHGAHLVPMYAFGENELYHVFDTFKGFRMWLQKTFQISFCITLGKYGTQFPLKTKVTVEIGRPIPVTAIDTKTLSKEEEVKLVDELHEKFISEMRRLFDRTKVRNGYKETDELIVL